MQRCIADVAVLLQTSSAPHTFVIISLLNEHLHLAISVLPDRAVPAVGVSSRDGAHLRASRCVLIHIHDVIIHRKDWGFVHVSHSYFKGGGIFERAEKGKTRIHVCVGPLDVERVGLLPLVVQELFG